MQKFTTFHEFYPFYLQEHSHPINRRLHFIGTTLLLLILIAALITRYWYGFILLPIVGYSFAWVGHFYIEKNKPATFKHPFYSLAGDFRMFYDILRGRIILKSDKHN